MMKIIASYNIKGGVGKTAAAVNLAYLAARAGSSTLIWDLDPQGSATFYFRVRPKVKGGTKKLLKGEDGLIDTIKGTDFPNLDIIPADFSYRHLDLEISGSKKPKKRLAKLLEPLAKSYDYLFLDCPPSVSALSEAIFAAADALLIPVIPTTLSVRTLEQVFELVEELGDGPKLLPFFSMADKRKKMHRDIMATLPKERPQTLASSIPYSSVVERMGVERKPVFEFSPSSEPARAFENLWLEVIKKV